MNQQLTQKQFADHKCVSEAYVSKWVKEYSVPLVNRKLDLEVADRYWEKRPRTQEKRIDFNEARTRKMDADAGQSEMLADEMASS